MATVQRSAMAVSYSVDGTFTLAGMFLNPAAGRAAIVMEDSALFLDVDIPGVGTGRLKMQLVPVWDEESESESVQGSSQALEEALYWNATDKEEPLATADGDELEEAAKHLTWPESVGDIEATEANWDVGGVLLDLVEYHNTSMKWQGMTWQEKHVIQLAWECWCPIAMLESARNNSLNIDPYQTVPYFQSQTAIHIEPSEALPFVQVRQSAKRPLEVAACCLVDFFMQTDQTPLCTTYGRLSAVVMAIAPPEKQVLLVRQALSVRTCNHVTQLLQQAMHEAVNNPALVPILKDYMSGHRISQLLKHPTGLFEIMAYIHYLGHSRDVAGIEKLCHELEDSLIPATHERSYKVFMLLAHLQPLTPVVAIFFQRLLMKTSSHFLETSRRGNGNFVINDFMLFCPATALDWMGNEFTGSLRKALCTSAHHSVQRWLELTSNKDAVARFTDAFILEFRQLGCGSFHKKACGHVAWRLQDARLRLALEPVEPWL